MVLLSKVVSAAMKAMKVSTIAIAVTLGVSSCSTATSQQVMESAQPQRVYSPAQIAAAYFHYDCGRPADSLKISSNWDVYFDDGQSVLLENKVTFAQVKVSYLDNAATVTGSQAATTNQMIQVFSCYSQPGEAEIPFTSVKSILDGGKAS
jgi:hypothetical protein